MLTPKYGSNPPTTDIDVIRRILEERRVFSEFQPLFHKLSEAVRKVWDEIENLYRLHREDSAEKTGGGGGGSPSPSVPKKPDVIVYPLCNIVSEDMAVGFNEYTGDFESSTPVRWALHGGRHNAAFFQPVFNNCHISGIMGTLWLEPKEGSTTTKVSQQHFIRMFLFKGSPDIAAGNLIGFDFGFERFQQPTDTNARGKFFIDLKVYPPETTNTPPTLLEQEIPISSKKFYSDSPILDDTLLDDYYNHGLWCRFNITIFVS